MKILMFMVILLVISSCDRVKVNETVKIKKVYSTKFCVKNKKLWAKSFLGKKSPKFTVEGWVGKKPEFNNKFLLVDFWGTHCPQCKKAILELNKIAKKYKNKLIVVGIATATKGMVMNMKTPIINYYSAYDTRGVFKSKFGVRGIPHIVIIAPDGIIVWEGYPFLGSDRLTLEKVGKIINQ